jgi:hypothetical protein
MSDPTVYEDLLRKIKEAAVKNVLDTSELDKDGGLERHKGNGQVFVVHKNRNQSNEQTEEETDGGDILVEIRTKRKKRIERNAEENYERAMKGIGE